MTAPIPEPLKKVVYLLRLETSNDASLIRRLRLALKTLRRQFDFRALSVEEERTP
jgi:hypothetical protein